MTEQLSVPNKPANWYFERHGLTVIVEQSKHIDTYNANGKCIEIPKGSVVGRLHFMPAGYGHPDPKIRTIALAEGMHGLGKFIAECAHRANKDPRQIPEYLIGVTNIGMAKFALGMGFQFAGDVSDTEDHVIIGKLDEIKEKYAARVKSTRIRKLLERARREVVRRLKEARTVKQPIQPDTVPAFGRLAFAPGLGRFAEPGLGGSLFETPGTNITETPVIIFERRDSDKYNNPIKNYISAIPKKLFNEDKIKINPNESNTKYEIEFPGSKLRPQIA